jgi:hypothetical protein
MFYCYTAKPNKIPEIIEWLNQNAQGWHFVDCDGHLMYGPHNFHNAYKQFLERMHSACMGYGNSQIDLKMFISLPSDDLAMLFKLVWK